MKRFIQFLKGIFISSILVSYAYSSDYEEFCGEAAEFQSAYDTAITVMEEAKAILVSMSEDAALAIERTRESGTDEHIEAAISYRDDLVESRSSKQRAINKFTLAKGHLSNAQRLANCSQYGL